MILLDTTALLAAADDSVPEHYGCISAIGRADPPLLLSPFVLAERHGIADVLTLDHRHFRALTWGGGKPFRVLPVDAS